VLWRLPAGVPDADVLERIAQRARIGVYTLSSGGAHETRPSLLGQRALILGHASLTPKQIEQGVARLSDAVDEALDKRQIDVEALATRPAPLSYAPLPLVAPAGRLAHKFRRRPALLPTRRPKARFARNPATEAPRQMPIVKGLYRYPVKGLSPQAAPSVTLSAGQPFPHDRIFALARPGASIDPVEPKWAKKGLFVMMMLDDGLADLRTHFDVDTHWLRVMRGNEQLAHVDLEDESGRATIEALVHKQVPNLREPPRLVRSRAGHFSDKPENLISLINLATVRSLEERWGYEIDPLRFRANIYIDGAKPWEEFEWVGGDIRIGGASFRVDRRNGRCGATNVNPVTGRRDLDIPGSLRAAFGHKDFGIYLMCREGGAARVEDEVEIPEAEQPTRDARPMSRAEPAPRRRFICRGCYYVYDDAAGDEFSSLPPHWRCPDCGGEKGLFRPYVAPAARAVL
jgi:GntR family transcriptional regulator/MocR family aminotransferase